MAASTHRPRVTVVVPCYNYGHYLPACVGSVLDQRDVDVDVLVIDDASTDGSRDVADRLAAGDPRVASLPHSANAGHISTYNEGLARATGTYVVLLSADDMLVPGALARATAAMEANPRVGLTYGNPLSFECDDPPAARTRARSTTVWNGRDWIGLQCRRGASCIYSPEAVVRTAVQHRVGGYTHALPHTADLEMWLRIAAVSDVARVNGSDQAYRRLHAASMMHTGLDGILPDLRGRLDAYESFFAGAGADLPRAGRDLRTARRRLAEEALVHACSILRSDPAAADTAHEYAAFAAETYDRDVAALRQWREYRTLSGATTMRRATKAVDLAYHRLRRGAEFRYRGHRWRRTGV
jgi:hypothetical protein